MLNNLFLHAVDVEAQWGGLCNKPVIQQCMSGVSDRAGEKESIISRDVYGAVLLFSSFGQTGYTWKETWGWNRMDG